MVTNTSNAAMSNVLVRDPLVGFNETIASLGSGESKRFTVTTTAGNTGLIVNTVNVTGTLTANSETVTQSDDCTTRVWELGVSKSATTTYTRTFTWEITKTVAPAQVDLFDGQTAPVTYTVLLTKSAPSDGGFVEAGFIVISNPAPIAATVSRVTDTLPGATNMVVSCPSGVPFALGAYQQVTCSYGSPVGGWRQDQRHQQGGGPAQQPV